MSGQGKALSGEQERITNWPGCTRNGHHRSNEHVGNEDYSRGSEAWRYVDRHGHATCSCCDPVGGFPCPADPSTPPGDEQR